MANSARALLCPEGRRGLCVGVRQHDTPKAAQKPIKCPTLLLFMLCAEQNIFIEAFRAIPAFILKLSQ